MTRSPIEIAAELREAAYVVRDTGNVYDGYDMLDGELLDCLDRALAAPLDFADPIVAVEQLLAAAAVIDTKEDAT